MSLQAVTFDVQRRDGVCDEHGQFVDVGMPMAGEVRWSGCRKCNDAAIAVRAEHDLADISAQLREYRQRELMKRFDDVGIPPRFRNRTFANYRITEGESQQQLYRAARMYAQSFSSVRKVGASLILCGTPGTGKTHLAAAVANCLINDYVVIFRDVGDVIRHVRSSWGRDAERSEVQALADLCQPDLLIIDDVGHQHGSDSERAILHEVINKRYGHERPTIVTSNQDLDGLRHYLGAHVVDRFAENGGAVIACEWPSYRNRVASDSDLQR